MEDRILSITLNGKNKEELTEILSFFDVKVSKSSLKKALMEKTIETFEAEGKEFLKILSKETQLFVNRFIANDLKLSESVTDKKPDCMYELDYFGLIFEETKRDLELETKEVFYTLSKDFAEKFSANCNTAQGKRDLKSSDDLEKLLVGIIRFYGVISEEEFYNIAIKVSPELTIEIIEDFMQKRIFLKSVFEKTLNGGTNEYYFFSDFVENHSDLMRKFFLRPQLEYKALEKEEYQNFWKLDYFKETEATVFLENLYKGIKFTKLEAKHAVLDLILAIKGGDSFGEIFQSLISIFNSVLNSKEETDNLLSTVQVFYNSTPQWELKGHTPNEMFDTKLDFKPTTVQRKSEKVSRNEVCPCGSGKKYKKCCGK